MNAYDNEPDIQKIAIQLLSEVDDSNSPSINFIKLIEPLNGGGNNRSYIIATKDNNYFMKQYYRDLIDTRNRLHAEYSFTTFGWENGIRCIAKPVACDRDCSIGIYEYIQGLKFGTQDVGENEVEKALEFVLKLNAKKYTASAHDLPIASEACFSLANHVRMVDSRVERLREIVISDEIDAEAVAFIDDGIIPEWEKIKKRILSNEKTMINHHLEINDRVLSPSDFGFHNALIDDNDQIRFIDFEYAGWDDPAKLVCDFFSQPAIPVPMAHFSRFSKVISNLTCDPDAMQTRIHLLLPLIRLKWCCITLNCFVPSFKSRKAFVTSITNEYRISQINKARIILRSLNSIKNR
jgi:hypothetical protein